MIEKENDRERENDRMIEKDIENERGKGKRKR